MFKIFMDLHEGFFDNDDSNKMVAAVGFGISTIVMLLVIGLYQL